MTTPFVADEERSRLAGEAAREQRYSVKTAHGYLPRRMLIEHLTPLEKQVRLSMLQVERQGAHRLLTDAAVLLENAGRALADWIDLGKPGGVEALAETPE